MTQLVGPSRFSRNPKYGIAVKASGNQIRYRLPQKRISSRSQTDIFDIGKRLMTVENSKLEMLIQGALWA